MFLILAGTAAAAAPAAKYFGVLLAQMPDLSYVSNLRCKSNVSCSCCLVVSPQAEQWLALPVDARCGTSAPHVYASCCEQRVLCIVILFALRLCYKEMWFSFVFLRSADARGYLSNLWAVFGCGGHRPTVFPRRYSGLYLFALFRLLCSPSVSLPRSLALLFALGRLPAR